MKIVLNVIGVLLILPGIVLVPARRQCSARQLHDWPDSMGHLWRYSDCYRCGFALVCKSSALIGLFSPDDTRRI